MSQNKESKADVTPSAEEDVDFGTVQSTAEAASMTPKTWLVILILSLQFGTAFWPIPAIQAASGPVAAMLGDPTAANWYVTSFVLAVCIAFMTCGANSDLFGRRSFILAGNILCFVGNVVASRARTAQTVTVGMAIMGFGSGNCQLASFALPELMPNKWRHIGVVVTDIFLFVSILVGPVAGRYAVLHNDLWRWLFYAPAISHVFCLAGVYMLYYPPKHPRGVPWHDALRGMDWVGIVLFIAGGTSTLVGCLLTTTTPASDVRVIAPLTTGLGVLVLFGIWENQAERFNVRYPLCPRHVFAKGKGRDMTAPFLVVFTETMFYYVINVVWPTQINVFWGGATDITTGIALSLPPNVGLVVGGLILVLFGSRLRRWKWTLTASVVITTLFGALMALGQPDRKGMMIAFVFINQVAMGWGQYLSIAYTQLGVDPVDLGVSGGLSGVARNGGGVVALTVSLTILANVQGQSMKKLVPQAALAAGLPSESLEALMGALPLGEAALSKVPGATQQVLEAALGAFQQSYLIGLRTTALASLAFGGVCIIACLFCKDIDDKMTDKIEVFLENDENAAKNQFH
ncbi:major facilitator superfamily transporter [Fusarium coicis]|nr:major facilitator superfamily transporter [Fusarium coicis]